MLGGKMQTQNVTIQPLGQVGYRFGFGSMNVYIDPYLSNSVQELEDSRMERLLSVPMLSNEISDADYLFITHVHRDHCDDGTIPAISAASNCKFIGPSPVCDRLREMGIMDDKIIQAGELPIRLEEGLVVYPVPSAHPEIIEESDGGWYAVGYIFDYRGHRLYHAGDTSLRDEIIDAVNAIGSIDWAFLPVNERNYFKEKLGILGNMSIREAFYMAEAINVRTLVPTHWDMFAINQVFPEEMELVYQKLKPGFDLKILHCN